jgi:hypothetical protein
MRIVFLALLIFAASTGDALAYVGPGLGLGVIGAFFSAVLAVLLAIVGVVWYPLKRLLKGRRSSSAGKKDKPPANGNDKKTES